MKEVAALVCQQIKDTVALAPTRHTRGLLEAINGHFYANKRRACRHRPVDDLDGHLPDLRPSRLPRDEPSRSENHLSFTGA